MIIARAPLRVSFGGGGTDLPAYSRAFGGMVLSASIDASIYVVLSPSSRGLQIITVDGRKLSQASAAVPQSMDQDMQLPLAVLDECAPGADLRIFIAGEVPAGTGLGSSSATTVALITALQAYRGIASTPEETAALACRIEIERLAAPIGKQDQYASAAGGLNTIVFDQDDRVHVTPLVLDPQVRDTLERRLLLFYTGVRRDANSILTQQRRRSEEREERTLAALHAIKALAGEMREALLAGELDRFGALLGRSWEQKRQVTSGITTAVIDDCYAAARAAGAGGGKIAGAGGGGFLLLYCREERQPAVIGAMHERGLAFYPFRFSMHGAEVMVARSTAQTGWPASPVAWPDSVAATGEGVQALPLSAMPAWDGAGEAVPVVDGSGPRHGWHAAEGME